MARASRDCLLELVVWPVSVQVTSSRQEYRGSRHSKLVQLVDGEGHLIAEVDTRWDGFALVHDRFEWMANTINERILAGAS